MTRPKSLMHSRLYNTKFVEPKKITAFNFAIISNPMNASYLQYRRQVYYKSVITNTWISNAVLRNMKDFTRDSFFMDQFSEKIN
jgi:hypothetical protein